MKDKLNSFGKMMWPTVLALIFVVDSVRCESAPSYFKADLFEVCPADGDKREINLKTNSAIFTMQVPAGGLGGPDFKCHLELEAPNDDFGFHIFLEEMDLLDRDDLAEEEKESHDSKEECPLDYIQFGRDELIFTTYKSDKYCGVRERTNATAEISSGGHKRSYVEDKDREMDFFIVLDGKVERSRNLTVVATVFKKKCSKTDKNYYQCPNSERCVRRELRCDMLNNCATFTESGVSGDEFECEEYHANASHGGTGSTNVPLIVIIVIVAVGVFVVCAVAMRTFYKSFKALDDDDEEGGRRGSRRWSSRRRRGRQQGAAAEASPLNLSGNPGAAETAPTAPTPPESAPPPDYEEVLKEIRRESSILQAIEESSANNNDGSRNVSRSNSTNSNQTAPSPTQQTQEEEEERPPPFTDSLIRR